MHPNHHVDGIILEASMTSPTYLINMIYKDTDDNSYYVMRKIGVSHLFVLVNVARIQENSVGPEESLDIHIKEFH